MARQRTPLAKAIATGQILNHATRYKNRSEPVVKDPLGDPPIWMKKPSQIEAWNTLADEIPWVNHSHRAVVGIASEILGKLIANEEVSINALNLLRLCLSQLGATPVDSSRITQQESQNEKDDPAKNYF